MISEHKFNTEWLNQKAGFLNNLDFFSLSQIEQKKMLAEYSWVELRSSSIPAEKLHHLFASGFWQVDTQVNFTIDLTKLNHEETDLTFYRASEKPFTIMSEDFMPFKNERFHSLPHITQGMIDQRYAKMANTVIKMYPEWCFCFILDGSIQGWVLSIPQGPEIELSLWMLHTGAGIRGKQMCGQALSAYKHQFSSMKSRFSIMNKASHNVFSHYNARFVEPELVLFWINPASSIMTTMELKRQLAEIDH